MPQLVNLTLDPESAADNDFLKKAAAVSLKLNPEEIKALKIIRRSVDARQKNIKVTISAEIYQKGEDASSSIKPFMPRNVTGAHEVLICGAGPAGLFAALRLLELGLKPVIIERGKDVSARKRDIARITREHIVDPDSNYCFGEGGAGTYSDGKLYTRSKKRGDNSRVLELLCIHGANENILYEAHPHLGTDKLPRIISNIRKSIVDAGGILILEKRITDILVEDNRLKGVVVAENEKFLADSLILASGHSSRDIYGICRKRGITLEMKPFAAGVRVEHPQELIDIIQYHGSKRGKFLPAASYNLVRQIDGRGVYSFCMCPGGFIVPSATSQEEIVVNGMSPSDRNSPYANSGIVVEIQAEDIIAYKNHEVLAGLEFQKELERNAWLNSDRTQRAPAQRLADFVEGKISSDLPKVSYFPGVVSSPLHEWLPSFISNRLREGFRQFGTIMKGFLTNEAVVTAVESRTSSPLRIVRDPVSMQHIYIKGIYPCGEGSGYTGGIVSSAVDGIRAAEAVARRFNKYDTTQS